MAFQKKKLFGIDKLIQSILQASLPSGFVGWFRSPNEISAIVSLIFPFIVIKVFESKDHKHTIGALMLTMIYIYQQVVLV